jgi:hypothetical protein
MKKLRQSLLDLDLALLEVIAQRWGLHLESHEKGYVLDLLEPELLRPQAIAVMLSGLSDRERRALDALLAAGGRMPAESFGRRHGSIRPIGPGRLRREEPWRQPAGGAEGLWYRGLIAFGFDLQAPETKVVYIPSDLLALLPRPQIERPGFQLTRVSPPEQHKMGGALLRQDMCTYLIYLYGEAVRPGPNGTLPQRHRKRVQESLLEKDRDRLALVEHLAQRLGLAEEGDRELRLGSSRVRRWLRASPAQQLRSLQQSWSDSSDWNELWRIPDLQCQRTGWRNDPLSTRHRFLGWLAHCPRGEWLSIHSLVQATKSVDPDFQRPDGDYEGWYIRDRATGEFLTGYESWERVEGALIRDYLTRSLQWLGVVAIGMDGQRPVAFRITAQGGEFLAGEESRTPDRTLPLSVAPNLAIEIPLEGSLYDRFQVARFCEPLPVQGGASSMTYRITPESLERGRKQEIALSQILVFLQRAADAKLPRNVPLLLTDWDRKAGKIRDYLQDVLGPQTALVAEDDCQTLMRGLAELGYVASVEGLGRDRRTTPI